MRGIDLADLAVPESETSEELRARHDAQVAAASPGVHRIVIEVGPGQRVETVDPRDEEIAALKQRLSFAAGCLKRGWQAQALRVLRDEEDVPKWFEELGGVPE